MSMFSAQLQSSVSEQPNTEPATLSRGNFYALFSQTIEQQGQPVHFDGMTSVSGLKIYKQSHIIIQNSGTYLISYSFTPCQGVTSGDFVGIKVMITGLPRHYNRYRWMRLESIKPFCLTLWRVRNSIWQYKVKKT